MTVSPVQQYTAAQAPAPASPKPHAAPVAAQPAAVKDTAILSEKAKDLAAILKGTTAQEEAKESPIVEMNEGEGTKK